MVNNHRTRQDTLSVRLSETEKELIRTRARARSLSLTDYILTALIIDEAESNKIYVNILKKLKAVFKQLDEISIMIKGSRELEINFNDVKDLQADIKALVIELSAVQ